MEKIKTRLIEFSQVSGPRPRNHREALLEEARQIIDKQREFEGYQETRDKEGNITRKFLPVKFIYLIKKTLHVCDFDLAWLIQESKKSNNFSRTFFGKLKCVKKPSLEP